VERVALPEPYEKVLASVINLTLHIQTNKHYHFHVTIKSFIPCFCSQRMPCTLKISIATPAS
jgi:hypothetical protein